MWTSLAPANTEIFLFGADRNERRVLAPHPALDYNATFSPDGRWIVFTSERNGSADLWAVKVTGGKPVRLTRGPAMDDAAAFSPDGKQLAFVSTRSGNADVWLMPFAPDGGAAEAVNLTHNPAGDFNPSFSPDGLSLAFSSTRNATLSMYAGGALRANLVVNHQATDIFIMKRDGTGVRRITKHPNWDGAPCWTLDGLGLLFYSNRDAGKFRIYTVRSDASDLRAVGTVEGLSATFGEGGRIFYSLREGGVRSCAADGSDDRPECDDAYACFAPECDATTGRLVCHALVGEAAKVQYASENSGPFVVTRGRMPLGEGSVQLVSVRGDFPVFDSQSAVYYTAENMRRILACDEEGKRQRVLFPPGTESDPPTDGRAERTDRSVWGLTITGDGQRLATSRGRPFAGALGRRKDVDVWSFRADGSGAVNLTEDSDANDGFPAMTLDGQWVVFRTDRWGDNEIALMKSSGGEVHRLTNHRGNDTMPAISADARRVVFTSNRDGEFGIYLLELDLHQNPVGKPRLLTAKPEMDLHPFFSPDGEWVTFASARGGLNDESPLLVGFNPQPYGEIYMIHIESGRLIRVTHNKWEDGTPSWAVGRLRR